MDKLNGAIHTIWYTMDKEELGSGYIFRQTSLALVVLHLADTLVKHGQAKNPYIRIPKQEEVDKIWVFLAKAGLFPIHSRGFCLQMGTGGFSL